MKVNKLFERKETKQEFIAKSMKEFADIKKSIASGVSEPIPPEIISGSFEEFDKWMLTDTRKAK